MGRDLAADALGGDFGAIVKLLMLTGCRRQEIGRRERGEFFPSKGPHGQLELPAHKVKNGCPQIVPLSAAALPIVQGCVQEGYEGRRYVSGCGGGFVSWWHGKGALDRLIAARLGKPLPHWILHDLRRSAVTHISELGYAQPHVVEAIVNTSAAARPALLASTIARNTCPKSAKRLRSGDAISRAKRPLLCL